jgi:sugar phosphate permease
VLTWFRERPDHVRARTGSIDNIAGVSLREAFRDKRFWLIVCAFGGAALPIGGFVNQLQPLLVSKGYTPTSAAVLVSVFLLATGAGRLTAGFLFDHRPPAIVAAVFLLLSALGALLLGFSNLQTAPWAVVVVAITLIGLAQGAEGDFIALFALRIFGLRYFSTLFATIATAAGIGFAIGGFMFAAVFDQRGDYGIAVLAAALILFFAALIALIIKVPSALTDQA